MTGKPYKSEVVLNIWYCDNWIIVETGCYINGLHKELVL